MRFPHRKLLEREIPCLEEPSCSSGKLCDNGTKHCYYFPPPPPPPPPSLNHTTNHNISTYLIISFSIAASVFILLCCYAIYVKFFSSSSTNNRSRRIRAFLTRQQTEDDDFVVNNVDDDDDVVDHPIWYIRTPGLQQSIISAITVCKYKKGEGLIDGTDCSVCLSEFEDGESLRLLPKCNHAFHLPCIDTWLASHTNCPMCRAPIVIDPLRVPSMNPNNVFGSNSVESVRIDVLETGIETETSGIGIGIEDSVDVSQLRNGEEEQDGIRVSEGESSGLELVNMQPRRSVSLDSSSAAKINLALSAVLSSVDSQQVGEVDEQVVSKSVDGNGDLEILNSAPSSMKRSRSFNAKHLLLPRHSSSQKKSNGPVRSF